MSRKIIATVLASVAMSVATAAVVSPAAATEKTVQVGGAAMYPSKNIIQNAVNSKDHTTLVAAVKAAGLVDTLSGAGPFTVFAPTNAAFGKLPPGAVDGLLKPDAKGTLTKVLTYHVVPGRLSSMDLAAQVKAGGGKAMLKTAAGEDLTVTEKNGALWLTDTRGGMAKITIANVNQSNGVIHVVDTVLMP
ncbi:MAG: fasciclin domain-containing protein [Caulobacterales bacterium]|nr:fasciclin domain-containing protein [Caulobacterales bacterium]